MLPILLLLVMGIIQYGVYFWGMQAGTNAAGDLARRLSVGDCQNTTQAEAFIDSRIGGATGDASSIDVDTSYAVDAPVPTATTAPGVVGGNVTVTVTFEAIDLNIPLVPLPNEGEVNRTATARVEDVVDEFGGCA